MLSSHEGRKQHEEDSVIPSLGELRVLATLWRKTQYIFSHVDIGLVFLPALFFSQQAEKKQ